MPLVKKAHLKNVFILLGGDFQYMNAQLNYERADRVIESLNGRKNGLHLTYSTPSCYVESIKKEKFSSRRGDFMPYVTSKKFDREKM